MAYLALIFNALIWGLSWWPFRQFQAAGLHPLWATVTLYLISLGVISLSAGRAWREFLGTPSLWLIMLAAGATNTAFNWGVALGDVVRVVLLFYLMPLWAVLLARLILGERLTALALLRMALALGGAAVVLAPEAGGFPLPSGLADWLGVLGGFTFALNNVMLKRESHRGAHARALAMFSGGVLVAGSAALLMGAQGLVPWPSLPGWIWLLPLTGMAVLFFFSNLALQYGAGRLPANVTAIVMLVEVPAAAISALWLGGGSLDLKTAIGGACIVAAAVLAALERNSGH
ncbi:DMT family transporter [Roseateles cavernae]|uniref:DMT family transporter n=1 Tax=Roseateles cavernae TaxID=3153578 RepID=UPI0032E50FE6